MATSLARQWWDIYVRVPESMSDATSAYLSGLGSSAVVFHEQAILTPQHEPCIETWPQSAEWTVLQGALPLDDSLPRQVAALQQWLNTCAWETPGVQLYCQPLPDIDYLTQWQQFFQPLCLEERLMIRPPWHTSPIPSHMACLTLNPGPAFGTGTHPSTHLCLRMLLQCAAHYRGCRLLDIGCGPWLVEYRHWPVPIHYCECLSRAVSRNAPACDETSGTRWYDPSLRPFGLSRDDHAHSGPEGGTGSPDTT